MGTTHCFSKLTACLLFLLTLVSYPALGRGTELVRGFSLTEIGEHRYDASTDLSNKTEAQRTVDTLYDLGVRHIALSPRAVMNDPRSSEIIPVTPPGPRRAEERRAYLRLMSYIKSKGMTVAIRPIFFVVDAQGRTPYVEELADGTKKIWWHGNIQPQNPLAWFESFRTYLENYMLIARMGNADEFTLGAELYSMTVGIEDQWAANPYGFPKQWLDLLTFARSKLPAKCRVMYDINFTDDKISSSDGIEQFGGEFARWRYRLVDLRDENNLHWKTLSDFWRGLDAIGIDMYRSLATHQQQIPSDQRALVDVLQNAADRYASQIDIAALEIEGAVGLRKPFILKEIGYRSVDRGFIDPFVYAGDGTHTLNRLHQAAAYEAIFRAFWAPGWDWFQGAVFWDASVDMRLHGPSDLGFSPIGKPETESILKRYFGEAP